MTHDSRKPILANRPTHAFIGRKAEIDALLVHAGNSSSAINVLSFPGGGVSELLRQTYDRSFFERSTVIPFYFEFRHGETDGKAIGTRFARSFLEQIGGYRREDPSLVNSSMEMSELAALALPSDGAWIAGIVDLCDGSLTRPCFSAPGRAAASGHRIFAMIDGLHELAFVSDGDRIRRELEEALSNRNIAVAFGSRRHARSVDPHRRSLLLEPLSLADSDHLAETLSTDMAVPSNDQTRDLISVQLQGNPSRIVSLFEAADGKNASLDSFRQVSQVYTDEIFSGLMGRTLDRVVNEAIPEPADRRRVLELLHDAAETGKSSPFDFWQKLSGLPNEKFQAAIQALQDAEIVIVDSGRVRPAADDSVIIDWIHSRHDLIVKGRPPAAVKAELLATSLTRAPRLMARLYRSSSAIGLKEMLDRFDCQPVPTALFDYARFRDEYKGRPHKDIVDALNVDLSILNLPQFIYVDPASSFHAPITEWIEDERAAVATGFNESKYTEEDRIAWVAAEIDSKLEVSPELADEWCDRLDAVAKGAQFTKWQIWLISPEGFSPAAIDILRERNGYGSSRQQAILLNRFLDPSHRENQKTESNEYEMVVPMGEDTELIAAQTVEEIAKRHNFPQKAINQIKTALVEACINAVEHSLSPDRKIHQKFTIESDRIDITVSNRGLRLADAKVIHAAPTGGRRGWGLSLMKGLMDEVTVERVDDGTRIRMTKFLNTAEK